MSIEPIDIKAPGYFFSQVRFWKEGKLAALNGKAEFSEISFPTRSTMRIKSLINYPRQSVDPLFYAWPEADLMLIWAGAGAEIADVKAKTTRLFGIRDEYVWGYDPYDSILLDAENRILLHKFSRAIPDDDSIPLNRRIIYDFKSDTILDSEMSGASYVSYTSYWGNDWFLAHSEQSSYHFYNWRTKEVRKNKLAYTLNILDSHPSADELSVAKRYAFVETESIDEKGREAESYSLIRWDEDFEDVKVLPLSYLLPKGKKFERFDVSSDGEWVTALISPYEGLYGEKLFKRVFFHMADRYPGGISPAVWSDEYEDAYNEGGAFFRHPHFGMCRACRREKGGGLYLRLYKMSDALEDINRQIIEKINELKKLR